MTENELTKLKMYESVLQCLQNNRDVTSAIGAFSWSAGRLRRLVQEIKSRDEVCFQKALENNSLAASCREELISAILLYFSGLSTDSRNLRSSGMKGQQILSHSTLSHLPDQSLLAKAEYIISSESSSAYDTADESVSAQQHSGLLLLKAAAGKFRNALSDKIAGPVSAEYVLSISNLFAEADKILRMYIDGFAEALAYRKPEFYKEYISVRKIERSLGRKRISE